MKKSSFLLILLLAFACFSSSINTRIHAEDAQEKEVLDKTAYTKLLRQVSLYMKKKKYEDALRILLQILQYRPEDSGCWYNAACCAALTGKKKDALKYLENAFENGWINFSWAQQDPDLESIRKTSQFKRLMRKKKKYIKIANEKRYIFTKQYYSKHYKVTCYDDDRVIFVSDVEKKRYKRLLEIIHKVNKNHDSLFRNPPEIYNIVLCPSSKEEYNKNYPPINALGVFMPATKTLFVNLDVGEGTLVHEYTHALHFADMEALKQMHPIWIIEGFATLFENSSFTTSGKLIPRNGFRLMYLYKALSTPAYIQLEKIMKFGHRQFMRRAGSCYAESRLIMYYLYKYRKLKKFYKHYTENYKRDSTGILSLKAVTGKTMPEFEKSYAKFVTRLGKGIFDTKVSLGIKLTMAALNCLVFEVDEGSPADKAGILAGDILYSYNGKTLKASGDLTEVLSREKPGDKAKIVVIRDSKKITLIVQFPNEEMIPGTGFVGISLVKHKSVPDGLLVARVAKDSPADKAGFEIGDIVFEVNKQKLDTPNDFKAVLSDKCPGNYLKFLIKRGKRMKWLKVKLGKRPKVTSGINPGV